MASTLRSLLLLLCSLVLVEARLKVFNIRASDLPSDILGTTDGYVKAFCDADHLGTTAISDNNANPWWGDEFFDLSAQQGDVLRLEVHDHDFLFDDLLGICQRQIMAGTHQHECYLEKGGTLHYSYTLN